MPRRTIAHPNLAPFLELKDRLGRLAQLNAALELEDFLAAERVASSLRSITQGIEEVCAAVPLLVDLSSHVVAAAIEQRLTYGTTFEEALCAASLPFKGSWPRYDIQTMCRVEIDLKRDVMVINGERRKLNAPSVAVSLIISLLKNLEGGPATSDLRDWLTSVCDVLRLEQPDYIDVRAIHEKMAVEHFSRQRYAAARFGIDLFRIQRDWPGLFSLSPAQSAAGGIYVPAEDGGNFVSGLRLNRRA